mgnify:CR=1 FL=1
MNQEEQKDMGCDPLSALNALDLAMNSQEVEVDLDTVLKTLVSLLEAVRNSCNDIDNLGEQEWSARRERVAMLGELADRLLAGLPLMQTARPGIPVDKYLHEVVETLEGAREQRGTISKVIEQGWVFRKALVRRAKVIAYY